MDTLRIYLAGPCRYEPDEGAAWRSKATEMLNQVAEWRGAAVDIINPLSYFSYAENNHKTHKQVKSFYMDKIKHCDLLLVNLSGTDTSPGTAMEVQFASDHDIQSIGFGNENIYPWLAEVDCQVVFQNLTEAINYIGDYYMGGTPQ